MEFLRTADILIECSFVHEFVHFKEDILEEELLRRKDVEKLLEYLVETAEETIIEEERVKEEARKVAEEQERLKKE